MDSPNSNAGASADAAPLRSKAVFRRNQLRGGHCKSLIVAVHGMGDQSRNDFAQNIAELFARHYALNYNVANQATRLPVGLWDSGREDLNEDHAIGFAPDDPQSWLTKFAFAEVHWAHIARRVQKEEFRLEESKKWAGSVVERLCQRHSVGTEFGKDGPQLAATVVEEVAETIRIVERLLMLAEKAGMVKINLANILSTYLGDVQQVADFLDQRRRIRMQFLHRMEKVAALCPPDVDIHIIAHSEGTVVAFIGLLYALRTESLDELKKEMAAEGLPPNINLDWIRRVRSFTTLGSPIDKHLILWPDMWFKFEKGSSWMTMEKPIRWRNYYDLADPVGFSLNTAREKLETWGCRAFDFRQVEGTQHDFGFRRYPLPGVAHINYFSDVDLFTHIINEAIEPDGKSSPPPDKKIGRMSRWLPFAVVGLVLTAAVFILHKAVVGDTPDTFGEEKTYWWRLGTFGIIGCTALLYGTTVLARVLRISPGATGKAWLAWFAGAVIYLLFPGGYSTQLFHNLTRMNFYACDRHLLFGGAFFVLLSLVVVGIARVVDNHQLALKKPPIWGLRWMMILGGGGIALTLIAPRLADKSEDSHPVTLLLSGAAFVYLWWFATLLFDLAFVWKTYINTEVTIVDRLGKLAAKESNINDADAEPPVE